MDGLAVRFDLFFGQEDGQELVAALSDLPAQFFYGMSRPWSRNVRRHASACLSTESASVPSIDGEDLRAKPLEERRLALGGLIPSGVPTFRVERLRLAGIDRGRDRRDGRYFNDNPKQALAMGADATASDARQAIIDSKRYVEASKAGARA